MMYCPKFISYFLRHEKSPRINSINSNLRQNSMCPKNAIMEEVKFNSKLILQLISYTHFSYKNLSKKLLMYSPHFNPIFETLILVRIITNFPPFLTKKNLNFTIQFYFSNF